MSNSFLDMFLVFINMIMSFVKKFISSGMLESL